MTQANAAVPSALDGRHLLALPAGSDVAALASAWFQGSAWLQPPQAATEAAPVRGARFRGITSDPTPAVPGLLRLDGAFALVGPTPLPGSQAGSLGLPIRDHDVYALVPLLGSEADQPTTPASASPDAFPTALPPGPALDLVLGWFRAAARRLGGGLVPADRSTVVLPDPAASVDLTVWSAQTVTTDQLLLLVRPALSGARTVPVDVPTPSGTSPVAAVVATYEYDGAVRVEAARAATVPVALAALSWREYGPWAYRVTWLPTEPGELEQEHPSQLHQIARGRVAPAVARVASTLVGSVGGTVVDGSGFVVGSDELTRRSRHQGR